MIRVEPVEERVLALAPRGRDREVISGVIARDGLATESVSTLAELVEALKCGAGAAVVTEEALVGQDLTALAQWLASQPPWSDFPFVALLSRRLGSGDAKRRDDLLALGNVVLLERPLSVDTLGSAASSAIRARRRQYLSREAFAQRHASAAALEALNQTLEARVEDRTRALSQANDQITAQLMERQRVQQAMAHLQKMEALGRLTAGVAHDFNNLLSVMQNSVELILLLSSDDRVIARAKTIMAAVARGSKLTGQLLSFGRSHTLDLQPVSIAELFEAVSELAKPLLGPGVEVYISIGESVSRVVADPSQMEMAMLNLAINARDAMSGQGRLRFAASRANPPAGSLPDGEYVLLEVSDERTGMPPEVAAKIFEPFFTTKAVGKGTGLGLSQVHGMAEQSGGAAFVRSQKGAGATIEVWLPAASGEETSGRIRGVNRYALAGLKILIVEDDDMVRGGVADSLASFGCTVSQAASGELGLAALLQSRPDLLMTDYLMPGMTGAELATQARLLFPDLPILVVTGYADMAAIESAIGENAVLRKPFELSELADAVARSISSSSRHKAL